MTTPLPRRVLYVSYLLIAAVVAAATPFPQDTSDLKADPAAHFGVLPNGLRYVVRPNHEPKNRASLRLLVEAGSLHETSDQRGVAHFLEHMAFNGSNNYAPNTLIEFFQRMGMNFGGDTNASTSYDRTLYLLELPDTKDATLAEGLRVLTDYAGGLLLKSEEIDKERGVILSEKRTRDSVGYRTYVASREFLLAGSLLPERSPIGVTEVLTKAQREQFVDFYDTWYRPELMAVIVVGDVDITAMEKQIVAAFSSLTSRSRARPAPDLGRLAPVEGVRPFHHFESEASSTTVTIATVIPHRREPDNKARRLEQLPRSLAYAMLDRRLSILAKQENAPFSGGGAGTFNGYDFYRESSIVLGCKTDQWAAALAVAEQELRRALEHGFAASELKEAVARRLNGLEQAVKGAATRRSGPMADSIARDLLTRTVFTAPADERALLKPALEQVTTEDCVNALRAMWAPKDRRVLVTGNAKIEGDAAAAIVSTYEKSRLVPVKAPEATTESVWAYTDFGAPGKVEKREHISDLDVTLITFANGVRLNLKKTDFTANRISVSARIGSGRLTEPRAQPGLATYAATAFTPGGLGKHSVDELRSILAGKTATVSFGVGADAVVGNGSTNRDNLLLACQLMAAHITDPGYRPESARQVRKAIDQLYLSFEHTTSGPFNLEIAQLLASGDHRFGFPPKDEMLKRNFDEVKAWLGPQLARGAIEVAIVGDLDVEETISAMAQTMGALPKREPRLPLDELRQVAFPARPLVKDYTIPTEIPKGTVSIYWPTTDGRDARRALRLRLLADVLRDRLRLKVREELGDAYSPSAGSSSGDLYPGYGYIVSSITIDPPKSQPIADVVIALGKTLADEGVTDDELERMKKPALTAIRESARINPYWLGVLGRAQEKPEQLDRARTREADLVAVTSAEVSALAKAYLGADRASRVIIVPGIKRAAGEAATGANVP